jgi:predicted nucleotidyltransferase
VNLAFPLCHEPWHEERVRAGLARAVAFLQERVPPPVLAAVVLMGSFARGEGAVLRSADGLRVLGDIELFVVVRPSRSYRRLRRHCAGWGREASALLARDGVQVDLEFGPVELGYLRERARPSIFVWDLVQHGKVLWGPADLLDQVPRFGPEAIPREDALFLLFNRTVEQLEAWDQAAVPAGARVLDLAYQRVKLTLDLAGSALAFSRAHCSQYRRRPAAFARLCAETPSLAARLPAAFADELVAAAEAKHAPEGSPLLAPPGDLEDQRAWLRARLLAAVPVVTAFLRWELATLLDAEDELPALLDRWLATARPGRRLREWAKLALHPLPAPLPLSPVRAARLVGRSTPRALLYAAATLAYLRLTEPHVVPGGVDALLPLRRPALPATATRERQAVVALWRWCVRNN